MQAVIFFTEHKASWGQMSGMHISLAEDEVSRLQFAGIHIILIDTI